MNKLYNLLKENFNFNEPIFIDDIKNFYPNYSSKYIYKLLKPYILGNKILRYDKGIYYLPTFTSLGQSKLNIQNVIEKKFIKNNNNIFGSYIGLNLLNNIGFTNQVPNIFEIITNKETNIKRMVKFGNTKVILRAPKTKIDKYNIGYIQFLELINFLNENELFNKKEKILEYKQTLKLDNKKLIEIAKNYPNKISASILKNGEMYGIFT